MAPLKDNSFIAVFNRATTLNKASESVWCFVTQTQVLLLLCCTAVLAHLIGILAAFLLDYSNREEYLLIPFFFSWHLTTLLNYFSKRRALNTHFKKKEVF